MTKSSTPQRDYLVVAADSKMFTIRRGEWKLLTALGSGGFSKPKKRAPQPDEPTGQLYNLESDLGETKNLYEDYPEIVTELTETLNRIVDSGKSR